LPKVIHHEKVSQWTDRKGANLGVKISPPGKPIENKKRYPSPGPNEYHSESWKLQSQFPNNIRKFYGTKDQRVTVIDEAFHVGKESPFLKYDPININKIK
jgi:hypothetical protein